MMINSLLYKQHGKLRSRNGFLVESIYIYKRVMDVIIDNGRHFLREFLYILPMLNTLTVNCYLFLHDNLILIICKY